MALAAMESPDFEIKQEAKDIYMKITKDLVEDPAFFSKIPYNTRKFIFVLGTEKQLHGCYDKDGNIIRVYIKRSSDINPIPCWASASQHFIHWSSVQTSNVSSI